MKMRKSKENALIRSRALAVLFSLVAAALIMLPVIASAKGGDKAKTPGKVYMQPLYKASHAAITIDEFGEGRYIISIESKTGNDVFYNEILKSPERFSKVFDLSRLQDGDYTLKVKIKGKASERHFNITDGKIKVYYDEMEKPVFKKRDESALLLLPNSSKQSFSIKVLSPKGETLYKTVEQKQNIKKLFDFSEIEAGEYTLLVSSKHKQYSYNFQNN